MMSRNCKRLCMFLIMTSVLVTLFSFCPNLCAYALNKDYIEGENQGGWYKRDVNYMYDETDTSFNGFVKHIIDEENGCYYIFFSFYDKSIKNYNDDIVVLTFIVENDVNRYEFSLNKFGLVNTDESISKHLNIENNFSDCPEGFGAFFAGFEFKSKIDKQLKSYITCEYTSASGQIDTLFESVPIDMYVEPTTKHTTTKKEKTTKKKSNSKKKTTDKNNSKTTSRKANESTTKFKAEGKYTTSHNTAVKDVTANSVATSVSTVNENVSVETTTKAVEGYYISEVMSKPSIILIILGAVIGLSGLVILLFTFVSKFADKKSDNQNKKDEKSESDKNNSDNNTTDEKDLKENNKSGEK